MIDICSGGQVTSKKELVTVASYFAKKYLSYSYKFKKVTSLVRAGGTATQTPRLGENPDLVRGPGLNTTAIFFYLDVILMRVTTPHWFVYVCVERC